MLSQDADAPTVDPENGKALAALAALLRNGSPRPIAFVGAGIGLEVGYPDWNGLLAHLDQAVPSLPASWTPEDRLALASTDDLLWRAEIYREWLGKDYGSAVRRVFRRPSTVGPLATTLVALPFAHFLTTNYDNLLQRAMKKCYKTVDGTNRAEIRKFLAEISLSSSRSRRTERRVVHLHGKLHARSDDPERIILTESDYIRRYVASDDARKELFTIFATQPVVFVGFSLNDPDLVRFVRETRVGEMGEARHFALLPITKRDPRPQVTRRRLERKFGIRPIFYPVVRNHTKLRTILLELRPSRRRARATRSRAQHVSTTALAWPGPAKSTVRHSDDPQKGCWGGKARVRGRRLTAKVETIERDWFRVTLTIEATSKALPLKGPVRFHVHDTFPQETYTVELASDRRSASLTLASYGAYTVGAEIQGEQARLELDLAKIRDAPKAFREA